VNPEPDGGTPVDDVCCCDFREDQYWHCTQSLRPDALCNIPWHSCCDQEWTLCE
jgi:hypothetical protein